MYRLALFLTLLCQFAAAEQYVVGVEEIDYLPYYGLEAGEYAGFAREMLDAAAEHTGHIFVYRPLPIQRLYRELVSGQVDFKFPDNKSWSSLDREKYQLTYSEPIVGYIDGILIKEGERYELDEFTQVGFVRGFAPWTLKSRIDKGLIMASELNSLKSLLKSLDKGRFQGAYFNIAVAQRLSELTGVAPLVFADSLPHDQSNYRISTLQHKELVPGLNDFFASPAADEIRRRYNLVVH